MRPLILLSALFIFSITALAQNGSISGKVTYGGSTPLHDATVQLMQTGRIVRTDAEGNYTITDVAPGRYTVLAHVEGFSDVTRVVVVAAGSEARADLNLRVAALQEQVTVTATGTEQSVFDSFQTVNSVGSTRIMQKAATSIGEVLESETGVAKRSFGPGPSRPVIRGFDGDRVLVVQDGIRTGSLASQSGDHAEPVDPVGAERIEVLKGPATLLYGSNAIGGVVNVIDHHDNDFVSGFRGFLTGVTGSADKQAGFAGGGEYGYKNFMFRGKAGAQRTGNFSTPEGVVPNSRSRSNNGSFGLGYYGEKAWIDGSFAVDIRKFGVPYAGEFHGHHEEHEHLSFLAGEDEHEHEHEEIDVSLRSRAYNTKFSGGFRDLTNPFLRGMQYSFFYSDYKHDEIETEIEHNESEIATVYKNKTFSYRTLFEQQRAGRLTGRFGFEGFNRNYRVDGEEQLVNGKIAHNSFSAYALEEIDLKRVKFQFGGRIENNRYNPEDPLLTDRDFTAFSGGAGINVGLWEGGALVANYTHSTRAPALEELYNHGPHIGNMTYEVGNDALKTERSNGIDVSLRHISDKFRLTGDVFHYSISNFVYLAAADEDEDGEPDTEHGLFVGNYTQDNAAFTGAELSAEASFNRFIGAFLNFDTVRARLTDRDENLPRIPPARVRLGLDLRYKDLTVRPELLFAARQKKVSPLETQTDGYGLLNIAGSYTIGRQHHAHIFSVNAYNLTNKLYRNHLSFVKDLVPEIGRGIRFGYTVRFF